MIVLGRLLIAGLVLAYLAGALTIVGDIARNAPSAAADLASR